MKQLCRKCETTMRIGIITDIHNNLAALSLMLEMFQAEGCEKIICAGDIIGIGPQPEETVKALMQIPNLIAVKGNHDRYLTEGLPESVPNSEHMDLGEMEHHRWEHSLLSKESFDFISSLPDTANTVIDGVSISVLHYAMNSENKFFSLTPKPDIDDCCRMFNGFTSDVIIYGHDHAPSFNTDGKRLFINCGSLGCPGKDKDIARGGILTVENSKASFEAVNIKYDVKAVIDLIDKLRYPEAEMIKQFFYGVKP